MKDLESRLQPHQYLKIKLITGKFYADFFARGGDEYVATGVGQTILGAMIDLESKLNEQFWSTERRME